MAIQKRNDELVNLLSADFQLRREQNFGWANACSMFQQLCGLRGFWPMSASDSSGNAQDQSGHGHVLSYNGNPVYGQDLTTARSLASYIRFDGVGDILSRADEADLDILGTETLFASQASSAGAARGMTVGGWFYPEQNAAADSLMSKWGAAGQRSWILQLRGDVAGDPIDFYISDDGTNSDVVQSSNGYTVNTWQWMAARFNDADAGEEQAIWLNGTKTTDVTARASIFNSNAGVYIGSDVGVGNLFTGRASLCFLCAAALPDVTIWTLYQQTRALFGV